MAHSVDEFRRPGRLLFEDRNFAGGSRRDPHGVGDDVTVGQVRQFHGQRGGAGGHLDRRQLFPHRATICEIVRREGLVGQRGSERDAVGENPERGLRGVVLAGRPGGGNLVRFARVQAAERPGGPAPEFRA